MKSFFAGHLLDFTVDLRFVDTAYWYFKTNAGRNTSIVYTHSPQSRLRVIIEERSRERSVRPRMLFADPDAKTLPPVL